MIILGVGGRGPPEWATMGAWGMRDVTQSLRVATSGVRGATSTGLLKPQNPLVAARIARDLRKWGRTRRWATAWASAQPEELAIIDVDDQLHPRSRSPRSSTASTPSPKACWTGA